MQVGVSMGIRFYCPKGHKLNVKRFQAGLRGICPYCGVKIQIPTESTRPSSKQEQGDTEPVATPAADQVAATSPRTPVEEPLPPFQPSPIAAPVQEDISPQPPSVTSEPLAMAFESPPLEVETSSPASDDPLAEAGNVVWYVRPASGGQFGPATGEVMRAWIDEGRVAPDSLVWREGWRDWEPAADVFLQFRAAENSTPAGAIQTSGSVAATMRRGRTRSRRKSNHSQAMLIIGLVFVVIVLSIVFVWVLMNDPAARASGGSVFSWPVWPNVIVRFPLWFL